MSKIRRVREIVRSYDSWSIAKDLVLFFPSETAAESARRGFGPYLFFEVTQEIATSLTADVLKSEPLVTLGRARWTASVLLSPVNSAIAATSFSIRALDAQCHGIA